MQVYSLSTLLQFVCKNTEKYGMAVAFDFDSEIQADSNLDGFDMTEWISSDQDISLLQEGAGIVLFDSQEEAEKVFRQIEWPWHAITANPDGELEYDSGDR